MLLFILLFFGLQKEVYSKLIELPLEDEIPFISKLVELPLEDELIPVTNVPPPPSTILNSSSQTNNIFSGRGLILSSILILATLITLTQIYLVRQSRQQIRAKHALYTRQLKDAVSSENQTELERLLQHIPLGHPQKPIKQAQIKLKTLREQDITLLNRVLQATATDTISLKPTTLPLSLSKDKELCQNLQTLQTSEKQIQKEELAIVSPSKQGQRPRSMGSPSSTSLSSVLQEAGPRLRRESRIIAEETGVSEQKVKETLFAQMVQHHSNSNLLQQELDLKTQHHLATMLQRQTQLDEDKKSHKQNKELVEKSIQENKKNLEKKLSQDQILHDETLNDTRKARTDNKRERDLNQYREALGEQQALDRTLLRQVMYWCILVMLAIAVLVLWDKLNMDWISNCSTKSTSTRFSQRQGEGFEEEPEEGEGTESKIWSYIGNPFSVTNTLMEYVSQQGCTAVQYVKLFLVVGSTSLIFVSLTYLLSMEIAILVLGGVLLNVLYEHLGTMLDRAIYDIPIVVVFNYLLFWPLTWRFCRESFGTGMEWESCGIELRPIIVHVVMPMVALVFAAWRGLHTACDVDTTECAFHLFG